MTAPTPDRTPTGDLRDRIAEALLAGRCCTGHIPRLADAVLPVVEAETAALRERAEKLQCQVNGYRGMKDRYLRGRNAAHDELIEAENLIELLCNDREAGQRVAKAALTEQRQRADEAERQRDEALAAHHELLAETDEQRLRAVKAEAAVQRVRDLAASLHDGVLVRRFLTALDQPEETPDA